MMKYYFDDYGLLTDVVLPSRSTEVVPPTVAVGSVPMWTGREWVVADASSPAVMAKKAAVQQAKWEAIKAHRDKLKEGGVKVGDNWFHSDTFSRTQQIGLVMMGAAVPAIQWKTMDNTFVTMSQALAGLIFQAVATADANLFGIAEAKRAAMMALDDPTGYDVLAGWPETHV